MLRREPSTKREIYMDYLIYGGDLRALPEPSTAEDVILYNICIKGVGLPQRVAGHYSCVLNSSSAGQNFFGGFYDLGAGHKVTNVKVKARFKVNQSTETPLPNGVDIRLFTSNSPGRDFIDTTNEYFKQGTRKSLTQAGEVSVEESFTAHNGKELTSFRYLKPFVALHKTTADTAPNYNTAHSVDVYELLLEIDGRLIDITDTIRDLAGNAKSNFKYVSGSGYSLDGVRLRKLPWFNKTVVCLGDSITFGLANGVTNNSKVSDPWVTQLQNLCGFSNARNNGISSSTVATKTSDTDWAGVRNPMVDRVAGLDVNADVIVFMGGVNDHTQNVQIGALDATTNTNTDTYFGAVNKTLAELVKKYPGKPIIAMSPMDYVADGFVDGKNNNGNTVSDFRDAMKLACEINKVHYLDLHSKVGFNANNPDDVTKYFGTGTDKLHPNQVGHDQMAVIIAEYINSLYYLYNAA